MFWLIKIRISLWLYQVFPFFSSFYYPLSLPTTCAFYITAKAQVFYDSACPQQNSNSTYLVSSSRASQSSGHILYESLACQGNPVKRNELSAFHNFIYISKCLISFVHSLPNHWSCNRTNAKGNWHIKGKISQLFSSFLPNSIVPVWISS